MLSNDLLLKQLQGFQIVNLQLKVSLHAGGSRFNSFFLVELVKPLLLRLHAVLQVVKDRVDCDAQTA